MKKNQTILLGILVAMFLLVGTQAHAQEKSTEPIRKGFTIGGSAGIGVIHFTKGLATKETSGDISLPNMKIGWFANDRTAIYLNLTGQIYEANGLDRSFEGLIPTIQYWTADRWWVSGGFGAALDTRALYESEKKSTKNEWGKGVLLGSGYEFKQTEKWTMDIQAKLYMASISRDGLDNLEGTNFSLAFGFTFM